MPSNEVIPAELGPPLKRPRVTEAAKKQVGRPPKDCDNKAEKTKAEYALKLSRELKTFPIELILSTVIKLLKESKNHQYNLLSLILIQLCENPEKADKVLSSIKSTTPEVKPLSPFNGLSLLLDASLSKRQYLKVREVAELSQRKIFPSYDKVREAKYDLRPPLDTATITEKCAFYTLESLAHYTTERIIKMQQDAIVHNQTLLNIKSEVCKMFFASGFDGSSGHSNYKQQYSDKKQAKANDDSSIFATTIVPLRLQNSFETVYWNNRTPQSIRFCRPLKLQYIKETKQVILDEKKSLEEQIQKINDLSYKFDNGHSITVQFEFSISMIDGKVLAVFTDTKSSQSCPICKSTPNDFNTKENLGSDKFKPKEGSLKYGISPLHAYIRSLEWLLYVSYKLEIRKWQARTNAEKLSVKARKKEIQEKLWDKMGLRVDFPNSNGSGTSNDGNTARRAFHDYAKFAELLGIKIEIVEMMRNILIALNSQLPINANEFNLYCTQLYLTYLKDYEFYKLPSSIHKILIHGSEIVSASSLPLGMMGEEGAEARNKVYKHDRTFHARKNSRLNTMFDMFFRGIDSSDPIMSTQSLKSRINSKSKRQSLPGKVVQLLEVPSFKRASNNKVEAPTEDECVDIVVSDILDDLVLDNECEFENELI